MGNSLSLKQRNKHIQRMLVEAARLAPRFSDELAVARKMVAQMLAVDRRKTVFIAAGEFRPTAAA